MTVPTLAATVRQVREDMAAEGVNEVWIRRTFEYAVATAIGFVAWLFYKRQVTAENQGSPHTSTGEVLAKWGALKGVTRAESGTAEGYVILTGLAGSTQAIGTTIIGPDDQEYTTTTLATISGAGSGEAYVQAAASGMEYNLDFAAPMTVVSPDAGIDAAAIAGFAGIKGGADGQDEEEYRDDVLDGWRYPAFIGTELEWARLAVRASTSVTRAWAYAWGTAGTEEGLIDVLIAGPANSPIPSAGTVSAVQTALDAQRHCGSTITVAAPSATATDLTFALTPSKDTTANRAVVEEYVEELFGASAPGVTILNGAIVAAASRPGWGIELRDVDGDGTGNSDVTAAATELPTVGTISWEAW